MLSNEWFSSMRYTTWVILLPRACHVDACRLTGMATVEEMSAEAHKAERGENILTRREGGDLDLLLRALITPRAKGRDADLYAWCVALCLVPDALVTQVKPVIASRHWHRISER